MQKQYPTGVSQRFLEELNHALLCDWSLESNHGLNLEVYLLRYVLLWNYCIGGGKYVNHREHISNSTYI